MPEITIPLKTHDEAILVLGPFDRFAKLMRQELDIEIFARSGTLRLKGTDDSIAEASRRIEHLLGKARKGRDLDLKDIEAILLGGKKPSSGRDSESAPQRTNGRNPTPYATPDRPWTGFRMRAIEPRNENQRRYLDLIDKRTLIFALGAAGTGKTYLAVSAAVKLLRRGEVRRLIITRPVVEAGEHLGFLPGDLQQKLNPYMRPIYDALYDMIHSDDLARLEEAGVIEVAPLAYMRGRTLSNAFVILDEAQNTTIGQMKMFLTRLGEGSHMVVTGDPSQNDLPSHVRSGLIDAVQRLRGFEGVGAVEFSTDDVVRHPLVAQIIKAYQAPAKKEDAPEGE
ncbi:MAG TPA: PhoH family protein [Planctomycetota bacterium]|nr:PhoH family protein [Planctomycetota bacterium]HRV80730.1 PhoH family protein [Planctomycetota bacterium]